MFSFSNLQFSPDSLIAISPLVSDKNAFTLLLLPLVLYAMSTGINLPSTSTTQSSIAPLPDSQ